MKKGMVSFFLVFLMLFSVVPAAFASGEGLSNFKTVNAYTNGQFADVASGTWFADSVKTAYELGLVQGMSDTQFSPFDSVTVGQTLAFACRLHSIYHTGDREFVQGDPWYQVYAEYAVKNGIVRAGQYTNYNQKATRAQFAAILAKALPEKALTAINNVARGDIPDVFASAPYADAVYLLYNAGILTGNDDYGTFAPDSNIQRSEVAAIVTRMASLPERVAVALEKDTFEIDTGFYKVTVPKSWNGLAEYEISKTADNGYSLTFYEKQSHATLYGGLLFSIQLCTEDYSCLPQYDYIGELSTPSGQVFHMIVYYPSDVQFIENNANVAKIYQQLCKGMDFVIDSVELKSGCSLSRPDETILTWQKAYEKILENTVSYNPAYPSNDYSYTIYDIDKDGTPEMFVKMGTCEADSAYYLYAYHENRDCAKFVAEIPAGHSVLCGLENEDAFVVQLGHQGYERITKYIYRNSILTSETLYEKADDAFHEYANLDGLPYYAVTDPNGLLWTGNPHDGNQHILDNL